MKTYKSLLLCTFIAASFLAACSAPKDDGQNQLQVQIHVRLPSVIAGHPERLRRFENKVRFLAIQLAGEQLPTREFRFPAGTWETMRFEIPKSEETQKWHLRIEVWDQRQDGYPRSYPVMTGEKKLKIPPGATTLEVSLPLTLQVSAENYE